MTSETARLKKSIDDLWQDYYLLDAAYNEFAKRHRETYASVLTLCAFGEHPEGVTQGQLSLEQMIPKQTVGSILAGLERRGIVESAVDPADRRRRVFVFTKNGRAHWGAIERDMERIELAAARAIGAEELERAHSVLGRFAQSFADELHRGEGR